MSALPHSLHSSLKRCFRLERLRRGSQRLPNRHRSRQSSHTVIPALDAGIFFGTKISGTSPKMTLFPRHCEESVQDDVAIHLTSVHLFSGLFRSAHNDTSLLALLSQFLILNSELNIYSRSSHFVLLPLNSN